MTRTILCVLLFLFPLLACAAPAAFYVAPDGNDANPGTLQKPFRTPQRVQQAARTVSAGDRRVVLRGGTYRLEAPLVFGPEDSGTTWAAAPGEKPVLSGGRRITGWKRGANGVWMVRIPEVASGKWFFRQLWVNGSRATRARTPNEGFYRVDGPISEATPSTFRPHSGDIPRAWAERGDVEMIALQKWTEERLYLRGMTEDGAVRLSGTPHPSSREENARYWLENLPEALDAPGEWFLDRTSGVLSYIPRKGEDMRKAEVIAPRLAQLVRIEGDPNDSGRIVHDLRFAGISFEHADWDLPGEGYADLQAAFDIPAAITARGARNVTISDANIRHLGIYAVAFTEGCKGNTVARCTMEDLGAGGVKIGEPIIREVDAQQAGSNTVTDCTIHDIGKVYPAAVGVWVGQSAGNRIVHNHIYDTFYTGISVGWTWGYGPTSARDNLIAYNLVHDIGRGVLSDLGGIYTLGVQPGTRIVHNVFHDIESNTYGGWGIYTDEGSTGITIEDNVTYRTKSGGFHQHYGRENVVRNNIFAFAREAEIIRTRMEPHLSFTFEHNIVYWKDAPLLGSNWSDDKYRLDNNLYWRTDGQPVTFANWTWDEWRARGQDTHSKIADPLFKDPEHGDFTLAKDSPALSMGFRPIDTSTVGPRR